MNRLGAYFPAYIKRNPFFLFLFSSFTLLLYMISPSLNPLDSSMFSFHDPTQVGRVTSFVKNLKVGNFPPRLAPEYSFQLGFPVFNFYAPTAYWITSLLVLAGMSSVTAVKLSFFLVMLVSFFGMLFFLYVLFSTLSLSHKNIYAALVGASVYVSSTYFATEIIIRGNLAESWLLALLPLALGLTVENSKKKSRVVFFLTTIILAFLFTSHNVLSLFVIPFVFIFIFFFSAKERNLWAFFLALLIDSYFFIPALLEGSLVQAAQIAKEYPYADHFLCLKQLWTANGWDFGGSLPGCEADTMSFKIGKIQLIFAFLGFIMLFFEIVLKRKIERKKLPIYFIAIAASGALFLTTYYSQFIWDAFSSVMAIFQFPWRLVAFGIFGVGVLAGYVFKYFSRNILKFVTTVIILILFLPGRKYFIKPLISFDQYNLQFNSSEYFTKHIAYKLPEYLVTGADLQYWRSLEPMLDKPAEISMNFYQPLDSSTEQTIIKNEPFEKMVIVKNSASAVVNIHYFPFWKISVNDIPVIPEKFDRLMRPIISVKQNDTIKIRYEQTTIEKTGNLLSLFGLGLLILIPYFYVSSEPKKPS